MKWNSWWTIEKTYSLTLNQRFSEKINIPCAVGGRDIRKFSWWCLGAFCDLQASFMFKVIKCAGNCMRQIYWNGNQYIYPISFLCISVTRFWVCSLWNASLLHACKANKCCIPTGFLLLLIKGIQLSALVLSFRKYVHGKAKNKRLTASCLWWAYIMQLQLF